MASVISASTTSATALNMSADTTGVLQLATGATPTTAVTIDTSQNVGIGTTSPQNDAGYKTLTVNGTSGGQVSFKTNDANIGSIYSVSTALNLTTGTSIPMVFQTNGSERMRIDSSGNVGIGGTAPTNIRLFASGGGIRFNVFTYHLGYRCNSQTLPTSDDGTDATHTTAFGQNYSGGGGGSAEADYFNCVNSGDGHWFYQKTGASTATRLMMIQATGNLTINGATATKASGTTWPNPSDIRLKDNVQDFNKGLTELLQVNVKTWEYNGKGGTVEGTKGIGVIADEIEKVLPETVDTYKAKLNETDTEETDIKRFDATEITWLLVKAIQEQQTIINDLKARIETLEGAKL